MKVSIIVPVYKVEKFLPRCLDSLVNQTIDDYEVILVNDGSPDNSQQIIDDYAARYPGLIKSLLIDNGGQGRARNFGLNIAQGEYIGFVDSDDWVDANMFKRLYDTALAEAAQIVLCDHYLAPDDGSEMVYNPAAYDPEYKMSCAGTCWDKLYKRELLGDIRFPVGLWYEDLAFSAKALMRAGKIFHLREPLYIYRISASSTMRNNNSSKNLDIIKILDGIKPEFANDNQVFQDLVINHVLNDGINRVAMHRSESRKQVITSMRRYARAEVSSLVSCEAFCRQPRNRRIIMRLNYMGLHDVSKLLLALKKAVSGRK